MIRSHHNCPKGAKLLSASLSIADYKEALIFLGAAGAVVPLFRRIKLSPVIGFLAVGVVLGPYGLGRFAADNPLAAAFSLSNSERMREFAELGVVFLLFTIGLELSFERLKRMRRLVFGLGSLQVGISAIAIAAGCLLLKFDLTTATIIGLALALSSTAIVMPVLSERKRLHTTAGRGVFAILLFQDLMVAPLLFMVSMLEKRNGLNGAQDYRLDLLLAIVPALLVLGLLIGAGRLLLRPLLHQVAMTRSTEFFMAACLLVVVGAGIAAGAVGLSMALGAFVAGLLLAETEYRREVETTIAPFKGLLLGLFFVSTGASLDLTLVAAHPLDTIGVALALIAIKSLILIILARAAGYSAPVSQEIALPLGPGGEFAFVMIGAALVAGSIDPNAGARALVAVTISMLAIPALAWISGLLIRMQPEAPEDNSDLAPASNEADHVIVIGFGRVGSLVADMLKRHDIKYLAVDGDPKLVRQERANGSSVYLGDATRPEFLHHCGLAEARAVVLTMNAPRAMEVIVAMVRRERPDITIVARARDAHHATVLYGLGATDAIPETIEASLQLSEALLVDIGVPMGYVIASIHEKRDEYRSLLQPAVDSERAQRGIRMSTRVRDMKKPPKPAPPAPAD